MSNGNHDLDFSSLLDAGISSTQLRLVSSKDENNVEYLHSLVLGNNYAAWRFGDLAIWRFGEEPLGDD